VTKLPRLVVTASIWIRYVIITVEICYNKTSEHYNKCMLQQIILNGNLGHVIV
jgi:hypothetical protein